MKMYKMTDKGLVIRLGKKKGLIIYSDTPFWEFLRGLSYCLGAFLLVFGFFGMYILMFLIAGI